MKNVKRILASVLITSLALSTSVAYAASEEDYLTMQGAGPERIDSKGDFTFSIHSTVKGNKFEVNGKMQLLLSIQQMSMTSTMIPILDPLNIRFLL